METSGQIAKDIIKKHSKAPVAFYRMKDVLIRLTSNLSFLDAVLMIAATIAVFLAVPFYPLALMIVILAVVFAAALYHPFLGLVLVLALAMPPIAYQAPALAWAYMMIISVSLIFGYMHSRSIGFAYLLGALAFSQLGLVLEIPAFLVAILVIGYKRGTVITAAVILGVVMLSGATGVQNTAYIVYNATRAHSSIANSSMLQYVIPGKQGLSLEQFAGGVRSAFASFTSGPVVGSVSYTLELLVRSLATEPERYALQLLGLAGIVVAVDWLAVNSRSKYKGTRAVMAGMGYPLLYFAVSIFYHDPVDYVLPIAGFAVAFAFVYLLEFCNIGIVKALEVRKQDIRMKFGEAFEDLRSDNVSETFASIGNYDATKKELNDAIIAPLEQRGIARAYNVNPAKGILLFGPPGTGKTMMMRALANEIRAGFFLVKASNLVSAFTGETEKMISNVFAVAKKNSPSVLFFDEIDAVAKSRDFTDTDEVHKQALSQLLMELDGFQSSAGVIVVGATNMPQLLDPALTRPGRLDKLVYMPLPDFNGRKKIFQLYLKGLPLGDSVNVDDLAEKTERYSGADIKGVCSGVSQMVSMEATEQHHVLEICQEDILGVIKSMKPSTSLAQLEAYNKFKIDFERRLFSEGNVEKVKKTGLDDVVGLDDVKKSIVEAIEIPLMHPELIKKYDIKVINGILLFGPPGTGKTMVMRAVANDMKGVTILEISGVELSTARADSAVASLREIFNRARENVPSIIFIDEIDTVVPKRAGASEAAAQITGALLEEMDGIKKYNGILVMAATNRPDEVDPAIMRPGRFDKVTFIRPPNAEERARMFEMYIKSAPISKDLDLKKLGDETKGFTGADIANVCRQAKIKALEASVKTGEEVRISTADLESIIFLIRPSAPDEALSRYLAFMAKYGER